jgi:hypothetical protein
MGKDRAFSLQTLRRSGNRADKRTESQERDFHITIVSEKMDGSRKRKAASSANATPSTSGGSATKKIKLLVCVASLARLHFRALNRASVCRSAMRMRCARREGGGATGGLVVVVVVWWWWC